MHAEGRAKDEIEPPGGTLVLRWAGGTRMVGTPCLVLGAQLVKRVLSGLVVYKNIDNLAAAVVIDAEKC